MDKSQTLTNARLSILQVIVSSIVLFVVYRYIAGEAALKSVLKVVKAASAGGGLDRVFLTGISPVILTDLTSGYNVAQNIYLRREFHDLCGFTETEIAAVLNQLGKDCQSWERLSVAGRKGDRGPGDDETVL